MTGEELERRAYEIERQLRAEGIPAMLIPGLLGAAWTASLTNLPPAERLAILQAHAETLAEMIETLAVAQQAPDGRMRPFKRRH